MEKDSKTSGKEKKIPAELSPTDQVASKKMSGATRAASGKYNTGISGAPKAIARSTDSEMAKAWFYALDSKERSIAIAFADSALLETVLAAGWTHSGDSSGK
jgi:hypothetical protein